jgi:hypothetical protein
MTSTAGGARWGESPPVPADRTLGWVGAIVLISLGLFMHATGRVSLGVALVVISWLLLAGLALGATRSIVISPRMRRITLAALLACQLIAYTVENLAYLDLLVFSRPDRVIVLALLGLVGVMALAAVYGRERVGRPAAVALVITHFVLSSAMVLAEEPITFDVLEFQDIGTDALLDGANAYSARYPDIYPPELSERFYSPGVSVDGYLTVGFPYPPVSLLTAVPGQLLGDVRIGHRAAIAITALLMLAVGRNGHRSRTGAAVFLTLPGSVFMTLCGWTEAFVAAALAGVVLAYRRRSVMTHFAFGLFLFMKQYGVLFAPLWALVVENEPAPARDRVRRLVIGTLPWFVISIGFALWDVPAFVRSVITWQFVQPLRDDSLSLLVWFTETFGELPRLITLVAPVVVAVGSVALVIRRCPRSPAGLAAGVAFVMMSFVLLSKQAFLNYYFLVVASAALALSAEADEDESLEGRGVVQSGMSTTD